MGLDCYVLSIDENGEKDADGKLPATELWYGRKTNEVHAFFQRQSGVAPDEFNCVDVPITEEVLRELERALGAGELVYAAGFFFGGENSDDSIRDDVGTICSAAREALGKGLTVFYTSWW